MNPLAWWIDYCLGAVGTMASRMELWGFEALKQPLESIAPADGTPSAK